MTSPSKTDKTATIQTVMTALVKYCNKRTLLLNGVAIKEEVLIQKLQAQQAAAVKVTAARTAYQQAVAEEQELYASDIAPVLVELRSYVRSTFGVDSVEWQAFGYAVPRKGKPTVDAKAQAAQQMRATRVARNVMGPKQRKRVKGVVPPQISDSTPSSASGGAGVNGATNATINPSSSSGNGTPSH